MKMVRYLAFVMVALLLVGCGAVGREGHLLLQINPQTEARTILPAIPMTCASYHIVLTMGATVKTYDAPGNINVELVPGTWSIVVTGKNGDGTAIGEGTGSATVAIETPAIANVTVTPYTGSGTYAMTMKWAEKVPAGAWSAEGSVGGVPSTWGAPVITGHIESVLTGSVAAGYYTILGLVKDGVTIQYGFADVLRIVQGNPTTGSIDFRTGGALQINITPDMNDPLIVTVAGFVERIPVGTNVTLTASSPGAATFTWFYNGQLWDSDNIADYGAASVGFRHLACIAYSADGHRAGSWTAWGEAY